MNNNSNQDKAITEEDIWRDELQVESPDPEEYPALYNISSGLKENNKHESNISGSCFHSCQTAFCIPRILHDR